MGPGFFLFNFWAKKYEVIFFNCGENFGLSIVQKIKRTMSGLLASFVYPSTGEKRLYYCPCMSLHHFKRVQMFIKSLRCGSKGGWDGCLLVWLTTLPPTFWEDIVVSYYLKISCVCFCGRKNRFGIFTKCFNKWKAFKKVYAKMAAKKIFFFKCEKILASIYFNLSSLTSIVKLNSMNIKRNILAAIFALGPLIVMRS